MPDLDTALDELGRFADRPPVAPSPLTTIEARGRRRRTRRRVALAATAAVAVLAVVGIVASVRDDGGRAEVRTADDPAPGPDTSALRFGDLRVDPATDLTDGQMVTFTGDFGPDAIVAMCASEVADDAEPAVLEWCDSTIGWTPRGDGEGELEVRRAIDTGRGRIDCAERPGRCLIGVRDPGGDLAAPVSFRDDLPPLAEPRLTLDAGSFTDGERAVVLGEGFRPEADVYLTQCTIDPTSGEMTRCDHARAGHVIAGRDGQLKESIGVFAEILTYGGWVPCEPCVVRASSATVGVVVAPGGAPSRPTVTIEPDGPYAPGQRVTLRGRGFQANDDRVQVSWCAFSTDRPDLEVQGDPTYGYAPCAYPDEGFSLRTDSAGTFVVEDFPLPEGPFGWQLAGDCGDPTLRCGLAWHPGEGTLPVFVTLFELRG